MCALTGLALERDVTEVLGLAYAVAAHDGASEVAEVGREV